MTLSGYQLARRSTACLVALLFVCGLPAGHSIAAEGRAAGDAQQQDIISKLVEKSRSREQRLQQYSVARRYHIVSDSGETRAEAQVTLQFRAPDSKEFKTVSQSGSMVGNMVIRQLQEGEAEAMRHHVSLTPENYQFDLVGEEMVNGQHCFVLGVKPRRQEKLLFEGLIWVQADEFAVVKVAGRPVHSPSWWVKSSTFVRYYQKIGDFWLPVKDETVSQIRLWGKNTLTVDYSNYQVVPSTESAALQVSEPAGWQPTQPATRPLPAPRASRPTEQ